MADEALSSLEKAAVLLLSLGEESAAAVMKFLGPKEVHKIGSAMAEMRKVSKPQVEQVMESFLVAVGNETSIGMGANDYVRKVLVSALGEDKAGNLVDRILMGSSVTGLEQLKWMDSRSIAETIRLEHPQIIAIVLAYLDSDQSADVLAQFPERVREDVLMRVAALDGIQPAALHELNMIMEKQFSGSNNVKSSALGGVKCAADILNFVDGSVEEQVLNHIKEVDEDMGQQIQDLMFVFENLKELDNRGYQTLLREISTDSLILALKGADEEIKDKFIGNMSKRAAETLREDLEAKGAVKLSEVETAQKEILGIARRLSESGEISLGGKGEELVG